MHLASGTCSTLSVISFGPWPLPESDQMWDATRQALRDPAQLMLADAEYDPSGLGS